MTHKNPSATEIVTDELCKYGCGQVAKYRFAKGILCCSTHYNSCPAKRKTFSATANHKENAAKSLETRTQRGITKSSQIKGGETRRKQGHYEKLRRRMQERWAEEPWTNNARCPILPFKDLKLVYQGTHEFAFLSKLEKEHGLVWVKDNVTRGPSIWYNAPDGAERLYISDFIIGNTIYEIKSGWTWNHLGGNILLEEMNKAKLTKCVELGYTVILVIDGEEKLWG